MMKFVALALSLLLLSTPSLAKRTPVQRALDGQRLIQLQTLTVMKSVLAHALPRAQRRLLAINEFIDDQDEKPAGPDELDLHTVYDRARINREKQTDLEVDDLSNHAKIRLAVARARALEIYRKHWA